MRRELTVVIVALATMGWASQGRAESQDDACFTAATDGQRARNDGQLTRARVELARCAQPTCDAKVVNRCVGWLAEVDELMPSIVASAQDAHGRDRTDVDVLLDGRRSAELAAGRALAVDPGRHVLRFVAPGGAVEQVIVVREREKARVVKAVFPDPLAPARADAVTRPIPGAAIAIGSLGLVSAGVSAFFGVSGLSDRASFGCGSAAGCPSNEANSVSRRLVLADVFGGLAVACLGVATWLFVTRPSVPAPAQQASR